MNKISQLLSKEKRENANLSQQKRSSKPINSKKSRKSNSFPTSKTTQKQKYSNNNQNKKKNFFVIIKIPFKGKNVRNTTNKGIRQSNFRRQTRKLAFRRQPKQLRTKSNLLNDIGMLAVDILR